MAKRGQKQPKEAQRDASEAKERPGEPKREARGAQGEAKEVQREAQGRLRGGQGEARRGQRRPSQSSHEKRPKPGQGNQFFGTIFGSILEAPGLKKSVEIKKVISQKQSSRSRVVRILREKAQPSQAREASKSQAKAGKAK